VLWSVSAKVHSCSEGQGSPFVIHISSSQFYKSLPLHCIVIHLNPAHALTSHLSETCFWMQVVMSCVVTLCSFVTGRECYGETYCFHNHFCPEDGSSMYYRNLGNHLLQDYHTFTTNNAIIWLLSAVKTSQLRCFSTNPISIFRSRKVVFILFWDVPDKIYMYWFLIFLMDTCFSYSIILY
jgi:hypothetical protein